MSTRKKPLEKSQFSLSAMVDVVFLLLLFFVATYVSERTEAFMAVNQPGGPSGQGAPLEAEVLASGYRYMGRPIDLERMESKLMDLASTDTNSALFIKVSPGATEGQLLALLDRCKKVKLTNLNLQTLKTD